MIKGSYEKEKWSMEKLLKLKPEYKEEMKQIVRDDKQVVFFGAGVTSEYIVNVLKANEINPIAFCDNNPQKVGKVIEGVKVVSPDMLKSEFAEATIYITTQLYYVEIMQQLLEMGFEEKQIAKCDWICQFEWENDYIEFIKNKYKEFEELFSVLMDEKSKQVLWKRLAFLITRNRKYAIEMRNRNEAQYFSTDIIDYRNIRNFIDIGTYIGDSVIDFARYGDISRCGIWCFEPDDNLYQAAINNLKEYENVSICKKAVSDKNGVVNVNAQLGDMQTIEAEVFGSEQEEGDTKFETCTLDSFFENKELERGFLKMDIEGAEVSALKGGEQVISKWSPILAICVYHKENDIIFIPNIIKKINKEYVFYLRHYSDNQTETVLYAIPANTRRMLENE